MCFVVYSLDVEQEGGRNLDGKSVENKKCVFSK